jgi:DNA (cytosine-5)-methyltransferase 1
MKTSSFTFIDLFAGVGGMRLGFEAAGGTCILTCEIDEDAVTTYAENFHPKHHHEYVRDIRDLVNPPDHDVLVAGFPCQPYSIAGLRMGLEDERGQVFLEIIRILRESQPRAFLLENVKGMMSHNSGSTFAYMTNLLQECGYFLRAEILNSMTHSNVPQNRERVFIAGFRESEAYEKFRFPGPLPLKLTVHDCFETKPVGDRYYYDGKYGCSHELQKVVRSPDTVYQWRRQYVRENKSNVCPALTANMGSGGHNVPIILRSDGIRKLTPRECANFQGFPKSFRLPPLSDSKLYHQFGNSVTVPLIRRIAKAIKNALDA